MIAFKPPYLKYTITVAVGLILCGSYYFAFSASSGTREGTLEGKVELDGQLIKAGTVTFICKDSKHSAAISEKGTYRIEKLPPGPSRIQVKSHARSPFGNVQGPNPKEDLKAAEPVLEIPEKYNDAQKSGLTCDVKPGPHTHDIQLQKR